MPYVICLFWMICDIGAASPSADPPDPPDVAAVCEMWSTCGSDGESRTRVDDCQPRQVCTRRQVQQLVEDAELPDIFVDIAWCESRFHSALSHSNTDQHRSVDRGLWQINNYYWGHLPGYDRWDDPEVNTRLAYAVYNTPGGINHWNASRECWQTAEQ